MFNECHSLHTKDLHETELICLIYLLKLPHPQTYGAVNVKLKEIKDKEVIDYS